MGDTDAVSAASVSLSIERPALYVVATPIGNIGDFSGRAVAVLDGVDLILCEDTRHSRRLLDRYGITTQTLSCHSHNEAALAERMAGRMANEGLAVALISDAGTPLISDPGYKLVASLIESGIAIRAVPGPSAVIAALSISGLPADRFAFEGFLPAGSAARQKRVEALAQESRTLIFYEAPHRLESSLTTLAAVLGESRRAAVVRELTKVYESVYRGTLEELLETVASDSNASRGECVVLVSGAAPLTDMARVDAMLGELLPVLERKAVVRIVARLTGAARNAVYQRSLELGKD